LHDEQVEILAMCAVIFPSYASSISKNLLTKKTNTFCRLGPFLGALFSALGSKNYREAGVVCDKTMKEMTRMRLKEPIALNRDYFWILCSLVLAIKTMSFCAASIQVNGPVSERLLICFPLLQRIGFPSEILMNTLCQKFELSVQEQKAFVTAVTGSWNLLRAISSMKDQSVLGAAKSFGFFCQNMKTEFNCFEQKSAQRVALLKMFSPGLNRKIAQGLLENLTCCSAICDAVDKESTPDIISCATLSSNSPVPRCSLVEATTELLKSDAELREVKRLLTNDFSGSNFLVKKAVDLKFKVKAGTASAAVLERVKESFESCKGDDDDDSEEQKSVFSQVADALTPSALKKLVPAVMTVVSICTKDLPAILMRLTIEYFSMREKKFSTLRNVDACTEAGIPFNPAQLAEPGLYLDLTTPMSSTLRSKYSAPHLNLSCAVHILLLTFLLMQSQSLRKRLKKKLVCECSHTIEEYCTATIMQHRRACANTLTHSSHFNWNVVYFALKHTKGPIVHDIIESAPVQFVLKAPPLR